MRSRSPWLAFALLAPLAFSCASSTRPWVEGGIELGTIETVDAGSLRRWEYRDRAERLVRVEHRTKKGDLVPGEAIERREYHASGDLAFIRYTDAAGGLVLGPGGFAERRTWREITGAGEDAVHHAHYDTAREPLTLPAGHFRETYTYEGNRLLHRRFFGLDDENVAIELGEHTGVSEIHYVHLQGVTPIVMEMLVDAEGTPIDKRKISGHTEVRIDNVWINPGYASTVYPYSGRYVTYTSD